MLYVSLLRITLFSFLCASPFLIYPEPSTVNFNNNANPVYNATNNPTVNIHTTSIIHAVGIKMGHILVSMKDFIQEKATKENYELLKDLVKDMLWKNRYRITGGIVIGSYGAASLLLIADYHRAKQMFWGHWKHHATFEDLCAIPQKELARELLLTIGQHNVNKNNPTDLAHPLVEFIKEIDYEIVIIKRYISAIRTLQYLHLISIFPTNEKKLHRATKILERVLFIKHIFLSWLADYNLTNTEKMNF